MNPHKENATQKLIVYALLCMTYFVALRISGDIYRVPSYMLIMPLLIIGVYKRVDKVFLVRFFCFFVLAFMHLMYVHLSSALKINISDLLVDFLKYTGLLGVYIFIFSSLSANAFNNYAPEFFKNLILVSIALWVFSILSGFGIGVDTSHDTWRLQGFATEPSNISHFIPAFIIYSLYNRMRIWLAISLTCAILTLSPTVYASIIITFLIVRFKDFGKSKSFIVFTFLLGLVFLFVNSEAITYSTLSGLGPIGESIIKLIEGLKFAIALGEEGSNSRGVLLLSGYDFMVNHNLLYSGVGFGSSNLVAENYSHVNNGDLFDSTLWASFVLWFGIFALVVYMYSSVVIINNVNYDFQSLLLVNLLVSNSINGGGVWYQALFFMMLFYNRRGRPNTYHRKLTSHAKLD